MCVFFWWVVFCIVIIVRFFSPCYSGPVDGSLQEGEKSRKRVRASTFFIFMINMSVFDRSWFLGRGEGRHAFYFLFYFSSLTGLCMSVFDVY